jgi:hypothetical protein
MVTIMLRRFAAAVFVALAMTATSFSGAKADWSVSSSCAGGWSYGSCYTQKSHHIRPTHLRQAGGFETEEEARRSVERDRKWMKFCKPVPMTDRYGVTRLAYAHSGCEYGRTE